MTRSQSEKLDQSTKLAKIQIELVVRQVQNILDTKQVISAGPFLYSIIQVESDNKTFENNSLFIRRVLPTVSSTVDPPQLSTWLSSCSRLM